MRRHIIIGYFGPLDRTSVSVMDDEIVTRFDLVASKKRLGYGIGRALDDLAQLNIFPSEMGLDFLVLAAHVHAADTRISRKTESQDTWTREIRLVVPMSDPERWIFTVPVLKRMFNFLTGDRWTIEFRPRPRSFTRLVPLRLRHRSDQPYDGLTLFSGGLDSLIGAIDTLESGGKPLLISHASEGATSEAQNTCFQALKRHYKRSSFDRLRVWMNFPEGFVQGVGAESTTRGRSFLFFAIGVFAGTGLGSDFNLCAPENGFIALNVPLDPLRLGSLSTRTMHPFYLARWNELLDKLEVSGCIENPYWNKTKGEMIIACANLELLRQIIPNSLSCSSPTKGRWQGHGIEHCGYCLPCLIRRAALKKSLGRETDSTRYTLSDLTAQILDTRQAEGQQVRSFQWAIERLQANPDLAKLLIHKPGPLSNESPTKLEAFASVYQRGMDEVAALLADVRTRPS